MDCFKIFIQFIKLLEKCLWTVRIMGIWYFPILSYPSNVVITSHNYDIVTGLDGTVLDSVSDCENCWAEELSTGINSVVFDTYQPMRKTASFVLAMLCSVKSFIWPGSLQAFSLQQTLDCCANANAFPETVMFQNSLLFSWGPLQFTQLIFMKYFGRWISHQLSLNRGHQICRRCCHRKIIFQINPILHLCSSITTRILSFSHFDILALHLYL